MWASENLIGTFGRCMFIIYSVYTLTWLTIEKHLVPTVNVANVIGWCIRCSASKVLCVRPFERFPLFNEGRIENYIESWTKKKIERKDNSNLLLFFFFKFTITPIETRNKHILFGFECGMSCESRDATCAMLLLKCFDNSGGKLQNNNNIRFRHRWGNNIGTAVSPLY